MTRRSTTGGRPAAVPAGGRLGEPSLRVRELLARSDAELIAADLAGSPDERFVHGHLAALRAGAAVVAARDRLAGRRRGPRPVWELAAAAAPELADWTARFADAAPLRAAVETGRADVDEERADRAVAEAADFAAAVRTLLAADEYQQLRAS
ncbi:SAV_6107 family HEPN domain-containing protein [Isoptericola sp. b441]|uniref:SAV_6107 family HEPN domain-containing protein n=1 Tax=Actinotalea lenta TaxID=3064654 RepID=A0ABT9D937_9CELL|nr:MULTISPECIES: SAV_6107 family HEPN domain-containing protein [unclassified Isoptericola]MDO8107414.1 SAV_6107 family HEPN domain-containing protein [Isoptericola sp. b441]MDO8120924.1 SAV_6107 family HEPN domain-containing protein [Isoptericola sp. b490]